MPEKHPHSNKTQINRANLVADSHTILQETNQLKLIRVYTFDPATKKPLKASASMKILDPFGG